MITFTKRRELVRFLLVVFITGSEYCFLASEKSENSGTVMFYKNKKVECYFSDPANDFPIYKVSLSSPSTPGRPFCLGSDDVY